MSSGVAGDLRAIFEGGTVAGLTDGQLLARFASGRAEEAEPAFAALVSRHGPMVLSVCRGRLGNPHDAEDAFQATFLTLARKAGSLRRHDPLGPWLHRVASHTSRRLRDKSARRRRHEAEASMFRSTDPGRHEPDRPGLDEVAALHEEIERLPERYRTAIVLCDLQGLTHQEAGRRLGRPSGTIGARVSRARERLRARLIRRGFASPAGMAVLAARTAGASGLIPALMEATIRVAMGFSASGMMASVPSAVAMLSREVSRTMLLTRLTMITAAALALGAAATGAVSFGLRDEPARAQPVAKNDRPKRRPKAVAPDDPMPDGALLRLGTSRFRAPSGVFDMTLSPDEATIVTVGDELIVRDAATGKERWRASGRDFGYQPPAASYGVRAVAFAPDSSRFYTPGRQGEIVAWETSSGRRRILSVPSLQLIRVDGGGIARSIDVAPDGRKLALGDATGVVVCDVDQEVRYRVPNGIARILMGPRAINHNDRLTFGGEYGLARFSPDGKRLAIVASRRPEEVRMLEAETGREVVRIPLAARLVRFAFSPDGKRIATTERDSAVRLYDVGSGARSWSRIIPLNNPFENYTSAIAYSPDGKLIAVAATDLLLRLVDASTGQEVAQLAGHHWYPWALAFAAKGGMLYSSGWDPAIRRWDVAARKQIPPPEGVHATGAVAASPDGRTLAFEDDSGAIRLVDAESGTERRTLVLPGCRYSQLAFTRDGRRLAGGGTTGDRVHVAIWELRGGKLIRRWEWPKGPDPHSDVEALAFTPDGTRLATAVFRQDAAYLLDPTNDQPVAKLAHRQVYGLSFSPDGQTLATAGWDSIIRLRSTETGQELRTAQVGDPTLTRDIIYAVCHAPEGGILVTAQQDGTVRLWQADNMRPRDRLIKMEGGFVYGAMCFSPDGLWLATGSMTGHVELWDPATGQRVWDRGRHQAYVYTVGFGRDARTLVSGGEDGACYVWDLRPPGDSPSDDPARLWDDLAGDDSPKAYRAIWALSTIPDRAIPLIAGKLRGVRSLIDLDRVEEILPEAEIERRRRMRKVLIEKDPKIASSLTVRRAISVLEMIGSDDAMALLDALAKDDPKGDVGRFAAAARERANRPKQP